MGLVDDEITNQPACWAEAVAQVTFLGSGWTIGLRQEAAPR
jgi:hypothetical protein